MTIANAPQRACSYARLQELCAKPRSGWLIFAKTRKSARRAIGTPCSLYSSMASRMHFALHGRRESAAMIIQNSVETIEGSLAAASARCRSACLNLHARQSGMWNRIGLAWCSCFHDSPMWPVHGFYECARCHRMHRVDWDDIRWNRPANRN